MKCRAIPYEGTEPYLFLSYCHQDAAILYPVFEEIAARGYRIWYDDGNQPGDQWADNIATHLENSQAIIAFVSENASNSHNCRSEITFSFELKKKLIPILVEDFPMPRGMYMQLTNVQYIRASQFPSVDAVLQKVYAVPEVAACLLPAGSAPMLQSIAWLQAEEAKEQPKNEDPAKAVSAAAETPRRRMRFIRKKPATAEVPEVSAEEEPEESLPEAPFISVEKEPEEILPDEPYTPTEDTPVIISPVEHIVPVEKEPEERIPEEPIVPVEEEPEEAIPEEPVVPVEEEPDDCIPEEPVLPEEWNSEFLFPEPPVCPDEEAPAFVIPEEEEPDIPEEDRFHEEWKVWIPLEELENPQTPEEPPVPEPPVLPEIPEIPNLSDIPENPDFLFFPEIPELPILPEDPVPGSPDSPSGLLIRLSDQTVYPFTGHRVTIGRDEGYSQIVLPGNTCISKHHLTVTLRKNRVYIEDAYSTNGTWVNGQSLEPGERVRIPTPAMLRMFDEDFLLICGTQAKQLLEEGTVSFLVNEECRAAEILEEDTFFLDRNHIWPDGTLADSKIHRNGHAEVRRRKSGFFLSNVAPVDGNATRLNGRRLRAAETLPLNSGDVIKLGNTKLTFLSIRIKEMHT